MNTDAFPEIRNLRYSDADGEKYRQLTQDKLSPFYGSNFKDIFVYAATYGYRHGLSKELERPKPNIPISAFSEEDIWLLKSIAIADEGSLEILKDEKEQYRIAERYANGAFETIYLEVLGGKPGEPYKRMMQDVHDEFERLELDES